MTDPRLPARVVGIAALTAVMAALISLVAPGLVPLDGAPPARLARIEPPATPIAAEADVFRTRPVDLAADPGADRRPEAHPRTLHLYRRLRAFPGAPPRIPHGLTTLEFRGGRCLGCHQRGGFVARFAAYAPVAPHPELSECLQCHVPDDDLVGIPFTEDPPSGPLCFQCHVLDVDRRPVTDLDWRPAAWPEPRPAAIDGAPPPIPHDAQLRGNCLACHLGAGAMEGIRTSHPERSACRQCHVQAGDPGDVYVRNPAPAPAPGSGAGS